MAKAPDSANSAKASNQAKAPNSAKASQSKRTNASSATRGASTHSLGIADKVKSVGVHHRETCLKTLRDLLDSWVASLMSWRARCHDPFCTDSGDPQPLDRSLN